MSHIEYYGRPSTPAPSLSELCQRAALSIIREQRGWQELPFPPSPPQSLNDMCQHVVDEILRNREEGQALPGSPALHRMSRHMVGNMCFGEQTRQQRRQQPSKSDWVDPRVPPPQVFQAVYVGVAGREKIDRFISNLNQSPGDLNRPPQDFRRHRRIGSAPSPQGLQNSPPVDFNRPPQDLRHHRRTGSAPPPHGLQYSHPAADGQSLSASYRYKCANDLNRPPQSLLHHRWTGSDPPPQGLKHSLPVNIPTVPYASILDRRNFSLRPQHLNGRARAGSAPPPQSLQYSLPAGSAPPPQGWRYSLPAGVLPRSYAPPPNRWGSAPPPPELYYDGFAPPLQNFQQLNRAGSAPAPLAPHLCYELPFQDRCLQNTPFEYPYQRDE